MITPQVKAGKTKVQQETTSPQGRIVYAYMRRSTTKREQEDSLLQQEEGITHIAKELGIPLESIRKFTESKSGYENRTRGEWNKMMSEIENLDTPCILMCRDTSRLSRNPTDNLWITNHLYGDNGCGRVIDQIFFLEGIKLKCWNHKTDKIEVVDELHDNYKNSLSTKKKSQTGILLKLKNNEFPYHPPHGLDRIISTGEIYKKDLHKGQDTTLRQNGKMPYIRKAFEMKVAKRTAKEISRYLRKYAEIRISAKKIVETIISNPVYIGEYTEKTTGEFFDRIKFLEGKPPIDRMLWNRANATVGKRGKGYGIAQQCDILAPLLKWYNDPDANFFVSIKEGKNFLYYQSGVASKANISEKPIIQKYISEVIPRVLGAFTSISNQNFHDIIERELELIKIGKQTREEFVSKMLDNFYFRPDLYYGDGKGGEIITELETNTRSSFRSLFERLEKYQGTIGEKERREIEKGKLLQQKKQQEEEYREARINLVDALAQKVITPEDFRNSLENKERRMRSIDDEISRLSESVDMDQFIDRLPEVLLKILELATKSLRGDEIKDLRADIHKFIELITLELQMNNKKELKIKLDEGLEWILNDEKGKLELGLGNKIELFTEVYRKLG